MKVMRVNGSSISNTHEYEQSNKNFKYYRNLINNKKKNDENDYKRKLFEDNKKSPESTWNIAKTFMNWKKTGSPHEIFINNKMFKKASEVAEIMNQYFFNKIAIIRSKLKKVVWNPAYCQSVMSNKFVDFTFNLYQNKWLKT